MQHFPYCALKNGEKNYRPTDKAKLILGIIKHRYMGIVKLLHTPHRHFTKSTWKIKPISCIEQNNLQ